MVLGIVALALSFIPLVNVVTFPLAVIALPFGAIAMTKKYQGHGMAIAGVVTAVLSLGVVIAMIAAFSTSAKSSSSSTNGAPGASGSTATTTARTPGLGQPASDGKFTFTVNSVKCGIPSVGDTANGLGATAQGQFCDVNMTIANTSTQSQDFSASLQYAFSPTGSKYSYSSSGTIWATRAENFFAGINPGNSITTDVYYDIPVGSSIAKFQLHDGVFSNGVTVLNR